MIPKATLKRTMKEIVDNYPKSGYDFRISNEAVEELNNYLRKILIEILVKARMNAQKSGRKTIKKEDIIEAIEDNGYLAALIEDIYGVSVAEITA
ncbi:Transcription factor CBF/NF-Y/histone domain protein [Methanocaldococcus vulcanius M7]|uniref:Transcription factor CBF/NF-Y/histone domain protein n=1 Tax=Methanocaldococcus vulcanius (strain ATCC 700851 / DSM 12094 / M7) TaxID=579137 RepID=C9RFU4_METVM|nr:histone-like protein [Methanocaldococcus vulcanius]ACX72446.1 Transcription factor CBF/NF-Y/histone domain protein [Methanocaldococcus vulcanius M7]